MRSTPRPSLRLLAGLLVVLLATGGLRAASGDEQALDAAVLVAARQATDEGGRLLVAGDLDGAVERLDEARELAPKSIVARMNLALALARQCAQALRRKDGPVALDRIDRALVLHPSRLHYQVLRGQALRTTGQLGAALRAGQHVVARSPHCADAWLLLADVHERNGDLRAAREALERVLTLVPERAGLRRRAETLAQSEAAQERFLTHGSGHFEVKYSPDADPATVRLALTLLEDAYARVTADLGMAPRTPARVVLYEGGEFARLTGAQPWVGALYANGTLRVPLRNLERRRVTAARVLAHEFTHHLLRERTPALPVWWHEGIAQFQEDAAAQGAERRRAVDASLAGYAQRELLIDATRIRGMRIAQTANRGLVTLFYRQSLSMVGWLVDTYGPGALPSFLVALGTGTDVDAAARRAFGADVAELWRKWRESL